MATHRVRWLVGWSASCLMSGGLWISHGPAQTPFTRPVPAQPLTAAPPAKAAPQMGPAQAMKPLTPLVPVPAAPDETAEQSIGCVVLGDGRVFQGSVTQLAEAYQVRMETGIVVLPFSQVRTVATTLHEAYQQMRESFHKPTANDHLVLGQWCSQNKLFEEASLEAQSVLTLEPNRKEALSLLKRAEAELGSSEKTVASPVDATRPRPIAAGAVVSVESQVEFSRHVQRLALNKCGNGACHGASSLSSLKLNRGTRAEQNLQTILKYIDTEDPNMSPLLVKARSADGPHNGLFLGAKGREQYATISAWVVQVAAEQNNLAGIRKRPKQSTRDSGPIIMIRPREKEAEEVVSQEPDESQVSPEMSLDTAPEIDTYPEIKTVAAEEAAPAPRASRSKREAPLKSEAIQKLIQSLDPDAFDPDEFNRMVHGDRAGTAE